MTLYLIPVMRQTDEECRIINVSSLMSKYGKFDLQNIQGRRNFNAATMYGNSKLFQVRSVKLRNVSNIWSHKM